MGGTDTVLWSKEGAGVTAVAVEAYLGWRSGTFLEEMGRRQPGHRSSREGILMACDSESSMPKSKRWRQNKYPEIEVSTWKSRCRISNWTTEFQS